MRSVCSFKLVKIGKITALSRFGGKENFRCLHGVFIHWYLQGFQNVPKTLKSCMPFHVTTLLLAIYLKN